MARGWASGVALGLKRPCQQIRQKLTVRFVKPKPYMHRVVCVFRFVGLFGLKP